MAKNNIYFSMFCTTLHYVGINVITLTLLFQRRNNNLIHVGTSYMQQQNAGALTENNFQNPGCSGRRAAGYGTMGRHVGGDIA